jgi:hypothetical protein
MDDDQAMDTTVPPAFAEGCALDRGELQQRLREIERLTASALVDRHDEPDRIVLTFDRAVAAEVRDLVARERACCGHLDFAIEEDHGLIRVDIRTRSRE